MQLLNTWHFIAYSNNSKENHELQTSVAVSESPFLASLNVGYPQVIIVDEGYEVRVSRADLGVHSGP